MPLGYDSERRIVSVNDTADLYAYLYDPSDQQVDPNDIVDVNFTIQRPDLTKVTIAGTVQDDGSGFLRYSGTDLPGEYQVVATFSLVNGSVQSTRSDFQVEDPFVSETPTDEEIVADHVWRKVEDCFDSTDGGPWMRDMTLNIFSPRQIPDFIDEALFDINVANPPTEETVGVFTTATADGRRPDLPLLVQGTFLAVVRHLMRAYTEQPLPEGGQIAYEDRRDYLQRWGTIYQIESALYKHWVIMWKRKFLSLGHSKVLVSSKAGRLLPAPLRSRNVGRGYW